MNLDGSCPRCECHACTQSRGSLEMAAMRHTKTRADELIMEGVTRENADIISAGAAANERGKCLEAIREVRLYWQRLEKYALYLTREGYKAKTEGALEAIDQIATKVNCGKWSAER